MQIDRRKFMKFMAVLAAPACGAPATRPENGSGAEIAFTGGENEPADSPADACETGDCGTRQFEATAECHQWDPSGECIGWGENHQQHNGQCLAWDATGECVSWDDYSATAECFEWDPSGECVRFDTDIQCIEWDATGECVNWDDTRYGATLECVDWDPSGECIEFD